MRLGVPWSVKGIEPEAREAAKQAAHRAGVTLGAWLNQIIMEAGTDEVGRPGAEPRSGPSQNPFGQSVFSQPAPQPSASATQIDMAPVAEVMREIVQRVESSERRTADLARRLEQSVGQLAERLEHSERAMEQSSDQRTLDPLERKLQHLAERLEESERGRGGRRPDDKAIQTLEKAVSAVVDHLETAEQRHDESLSEIRKTLSQLAARVDERDEEDEREEAQARSRALETHLQTLATRLEKMEHSVGGVGPKAVEAALKAIAEKTDAEQHKATIAGLQRNLGEITQRLERAENRTDETLKTFERTVASIAKRLEDLDRPRTDVVPEAVHQIESRIEQMANRLQRNEDMTTQAAQAVERAIAGMSDSLHVTENRSRETIESLHVTLERMTDRLGRLEKEAKAALSKPILPPQVAVGHTAGNGFVPGGQTFPVPNFNAPQFGGAFGGQPGATEFRNPFGDAAIPSEPPRALPSAPPLPSEITPERIGDVPPPFAAADVRDRREPAPAPDETDDVDGPPAPDTDDPASETARAANDFLAAARRAAQAAAQAGRGGPHPMPGNAPYGENAARFTAFESERESRRKKILVGGLAAALVMAAGVAAMRMLSGQPVVPQIAIEEPDAANSGTAATPDVAPSKPASATDQSTAKPAGSTDVSAGKPAGSTDISAGKPADMDASTETGAAAIHPEATPESAGADKAASSGTAAPAPTTPSATAAPAESPIVPTPKKPARPAASGPSLTPAPAKPVTSAPLTPSAGQSLGAIPEGERALGAAANNGDEVAQYELGQRYANGDGVAADAAQAAYWYGEAAGQGLAIAQYRLATLYEKGRGVPKDDGKARSLYEKAAMQGNVKAMHNLAVIYAEGRGTRQDFSTAARWFGEAAEFGLGDSQYNLAVLQERGLGVKQDLGSAYKWLSIAARNGDRGAAQRRDALAAKLDAAALAKAKVAAETWTPKRPDPAANGDLGPLKSGWSENPDITGSLSAPAAEVARAQAMLIELGYDPGSSDGLMGPRTRDAILTYQRSAGLDQTGSVNLALLKSLELAIR